MVFWWPIVGTLRVIVMHLKIHSMRFKEIVLSCWYCTTKEGQERASTLTPTSWCLPTTLCNPKEQLSLGLSLQVDIQDHRAIPVRGFISPILLSFSWVTTRHLSSSQPALDCNSNTTLYLLRSTPKTFLLLCPELYSMTLQINPFTLS